MKVASFVKTKEPIMYMKGFGTLEFQSETASCSQWPKLRTPLPPEGYPCVLKKGRKKERGERGKGEKGREEEGRGEKEALSSLYCLVLKNKSPSVLTLRP